MGLPPVRGRQTRLAEIFKVTPNAARKWLQGEGMPELDLSVAIADWASININWLLQGAGPKRGDKIDTKALVLNEAIESLPDDRRRQVVDFIGYVIEKSDGPLFVGERLARYKKMLAAFKVSPDQKKR